MRRDGRDLIERQLAVLESGIDRGELEAASGDGDEVVGTRSRRAGLPGHEVLGRLDAAHEPCAGVDGLRDDRNQLCVGHVAVPAECCDAVLDAVLTCFQSSGSHITKHTDVRS